MLHAIRDLVSRARVYLDDDHDETQGWITDPKWLEIYRAEYDVLYRKWLRIGIVRPTPVDTPLPTGAFNVTLPTTSPTTSFLGVRPGDVGQGNVGVLAVVGVAEDLSSYMRFLVPAQPARGAFPYWVASGEINMGKATTWAAFGPTDSCTVEIYPRDLGGNYVVRWLPVPPDPKSLDDMVDIPRGADERLVLGLARRAHLKESGASALLEKLIGEADAELQFAATGRLDNQAPKVRRVRPDFHRRRWPQLSTTEFPTDPNYWMYP